MRPPLRRRRSGVPVGTRTASPVAVATLPTRHDQPWDGERWAAILDRIEQRQVGIGLRFWGPPLWLEVTMTGPDSDQWSVAQAGGLPDQPWNWESTAPCDEAGRLVAAGADDSSLLAVVSEYTLRNLVLNA